MERDARYAAVAIFALLASAFIAGGPVTGVSIVPDAGRTQIMIAVDGDGNEVPADKLLLDSVSVEVE